MALAFDFGAVSVLQYQTDEASNLAQSVEYLGNLLKNKRKFSEITAQDVANSTLNVFRDCRLSVPGAQDPALAQIIQRVGLNLAVPFVAGSELSTQVAANVVAYNTQSANTKNALRRQHNLNAAINAPLSLMVKEDLAEGEGVDTLGVEFPLDLVATSIPATGLHKQHIMGTWMNAAKLDVFVNFYRFPVPDGATMAVKKTIFLEFLGAKVPTVMGNAPE